MSKKPKKSPARRDSNAWLSRPFEKHILNRAIAIAQTYTVVLQPSADLGYIGRSLEFPFVMDDGQTPEECVQKTREALTVAVATMLEQGENPPAPISDSTRDHKIQVELTSEENFLLEQAAQSKGFKKLSDFIRTASLESARS
jgi:predicted RNase H-like HicB family nuclease